LDDVAPQAFYAHEFGHHLQVQKGYFDDPLMTAGDPPEQTRYRELMTDAFSAYYLIHRRGAALNRKRVEQFLEVFFDIGDCTFAHPNHHGTRNQRMRAAHFGFDVADQAQKQGHILTADQFHALFVAAYQGLIAPDAISAGGSPGHGSTRDRPGRVAVPPPLVSRTAFKQRLQQKLRLLADMRAKGVWLLDASLAATICAGSRGYWRARAAAGLTARAGALGREGGGDLSPHPVSEVGRLVKWALLDSNQGPTDYEGVVAHVVQRPGEPLVIREQQVSAHVPIVQIH
jgi:hypothetical protein